jgi:ABC-type transporter Mla maintaining outer membrane lipid asymmetry permease subunit MlaE
LGAEVWAQWDELRHTAAVIGTVLCVCVQPRYWVRTVRNAFARQVLAIGVEPIWFVVSSAVQPKDVFNILAKSILPALFASASCCIGGLGVGGSVEEIPQATQRALTRSVAGLFVISAAVSLLTYL